MPAPEFIFLDPAAASMRSHLHSDRTTSWTADNTALDGIQTIPSLLAQDKLIVTDRCLLFRAKVSKYEWDSDAAKDGKDEVVKKDDHTMNGGRYAVQPTIGQWHHDICGLAA